MNTLKLWAQNTATVTLGILGFVANVATWSWACVGWLVTPPLWVNEGWVTGVTALVLWFAAIGWVTLPAGEEDEP